VQQFPKSLLESAGFGKASPGELKKKLRNLKTAAGNKKKPKSGSGELNNFSNFKI